MSAYEAARWHMAMPQGAVEALPGGERSGTFVWLVPMVEEEKGHGQHPASKRAPDHQGRTLNLQPLAGGPTGWRPGNRRARDRAGLPRPGPRGARARRRRLPDRRGRAGHRQDAPARGAARPRGRAGPPRALGRRGRVRARAALQRLRRRSRRVCGRPAAERAAAGTPDLERELGQLLPALRSPGEQPGCSPTSATAPIARCGACSS